MKIQTITIGPKDIEPYLSQGESVQRTHTILTETPNIIFAEVDRDETRIFYGRRETPALTIPNDHTGILFMVVQRICDHISNRVPPTMQDAIDTVSTLINRELGQNNWTPETEAGMKTILDNLILATKHDPRRMR